MRFRIILNTVDATRAIGDAGSTMKNVKARTVFVPPRRDRGVVSRCIVESGLRPTAQREVVYGVLLDKLDHPTADEVFLHAKQEKPDISMATVYNCLDALVKHHLVKQVNLDRAATRYRQEASLLTGNQQDSCSASTHTVRHAPPDAGLAEYRKVSNTTKNSFSRSLSMEQTDPQA